MPAAHPKPSTRPLPATPRWAAALAAAVALLFAVAAVEYAIALAGGRPAWMVRAVGWLTSPEFVQGPAATTAYMVDHYTTALSRVGPHMALGGLALGLGMLQLVPALRRRHPRWHRASGLVVWLATLASMVGAIGFLVHVPMREGSSGPVFHLGLWALSLLTLGLLAQAVLAVRARDHRSHMVWMVLVFACLATAPMLRVDWVLWGRLSSLTQESANLASGMVVLLQTLALMAGWLAWVGDRDLPARQPQPHSAWPAWLVAGLTGLSALVVLHEAAAALLGVDALSAWRRDAADRLPAAGATLWALGSLATMALLPREWTAALAGRRPGRAATAAGLLAASGALLIAAAHADDTLARQAGAAFWAGLGVLSLALLAAAHWGPRSSAQRNPWSLTWLALQWLPSQWPGLLALAGLLGLRFDEAMAQALVNGTGGLAVAGLATGYGARLHGGAPRQAPAATAAST